MNYSSKYFYFVERKKNQIAIVVGEVPEDRVANRELSRGRPAEQQANRLGLVVTDLTAEQRRDTKLPGGVLVEDVHGQPRGDIRPGDVITAITGRGQTTEIKAAEQFNKLVNALDRSTTVTLHVRRGEGNLFVTIRGDSGRGQ